MKMSVGSEGSVGDIHAEIFNGRIDVSDLGKVCDDPFTLTLNKY